MPITLAILAILAVVIFFNLMRARSRAHDVQAISCLEQVVAVAKTYYADRGAYPSSAGTFAGPYAVDCGDTVDAWRVVRSSSPEVFDAVATSKSGKQIVASESGLLASPP